MQAEHMRETLGLLLCEARVHVGTSSSSRLPKSSARSFHDFFAPSFRLSSPRHGFVRRTSSTGGAGSAGDRRGGSPWSFCGKKLFDIMLASTTPRRPMKIDEGSSDTASPSPVRGLRLCTSDYDLDALLGGSLAWSLINRFAKAFMRRHVAIPCLRTGVFVKTSLPSARWRLRIQQPGTVLLLLLLAMRIHAVRRA